MIIGSLAYNSHFFRRCYSSEIYNSTTMVASLFLTFGLIIRLANVLAEIRTKNLICIDIVNTGLHYWLMHFTSDTSSRLNIISSAHLCEQENRARLLYVRFCLPSSVSRGSLRTLEHLPAGRGYIREDRWWYLKVSIGILIQFQAFFRKIFSELVEVRELLHTISLAQLNTCRFVRHSIWLPVRCNQIKQVGKRSFHASFKLRFSYFCA